MQLKNYEFIEGLIKKYLARWNEPNKEIDHLLVPVFDEEAFAVNSPLKFYIKIWIKNAKVLLNEISLEDLVNFVKGRHLLAEFGCIVQEWEVPWELIGIGKVQCIDKLDKQVEILRDFFGNILLVKIDAQIGKTVGEIAHEKKGWKKICSDFYNYKK